MEEDSTADMQFARRTPGRFSVGDGSAGTGKRERLTASPRGPAPRDPGIPAACVPEALGRGRTFTSSYRTAGEEPGPYPRKVRISKAEAYSSVFTKSATPLASSAETPLKAFWCGGFLASWPSVSVSRSGTCSAVRLVPFSAGPTWPCSIRAVTTGALGFVARCSVLPEHRRSQRPGKSEENRQNEHVAEWPESPFRPELAKLDSRERF
jgi:hypothetical protein